jgi:purine-cytosine permease-like protein
VRTSTANNAPAYGYSLVAAGSFAALEKEHGPPSWPQLFLFVAGACVAFAVINATSTRFFRDESPDEPEPVVSLTTSLSIFSVTASVAAAALVGSVLPATAAWPCVSVVSTFAYIVCVGAELGLAAHQHPAGGSDDERAGG